MKIRQNESSANVTAAGESRVPATSSTADATPDQLHIASGHVLWTLTHGESTAQARRWATKAGLELELQIWTGIRVEGQEDLCWSQLFLSEEGLADVALSKKRQLQASGWLEQIEAPANLR